MRKKYVYLLVILLFAFAKLSANCMLTNWDSPQLNSYLNIPHEIPVLHLCDSLQIATPVCGKAIKKWPYAANRFVVIVENETKIHILIMDSSVQSWHLTATGFIKKQDGYFFDNFDFAKYVIGDSDVCIGVRVSARKALAGGGEIYTKLFLLKIDGKNITSIFNEPIYYGGLIAGDFQEDGSREHQNIEEKAIIISTGKLVKGHFELIKKFNKSKMVYLWDGTQYKSIDKEIIHTEE